MSEPPVSKNPLPENNGPKKITPIEVPLSHPVADSGDQQPRGPGKLTLIGLVASVLLALLVIFVLPELVRTPDTPPATVETIQPLPAKPLESPWQDAQLAKARREAQDVLNQILEKQQYLEKKQILLWARQRFEQAMAVAAEGDVFYRQREFTESLSAYGSALDSLTELEADIPNVITEAITFGTTFIDSGDAVKAAEQFKLVLAIDPKHDAATVGLRRSESLDQVLEWVDEGSQLLEQGELDKARGFFVKAVALDAQSGVANKGKSQVEVLILERDYNQVMSAGYSALEAGQFAKAERAFVKAVKLRPGDRSASSALIQARNHSAQQRLNSLLDLAKSAEVAEQWQKAVDIYQQILSSDASVIDARVGELKAKARAELDNAIEKLLRNPMRLATSRVFRSGEQTLTDAKGISNPGPRLQKQISDLQMALTKAAAPVIVRLISDNQTQVNLFKVGELGSFSSKQLTLKPGNYVATGVRSGYRDVRVEFQVKGEVIVKPITVICNEPV